MAGIGDVQEFPHIGATHRVTQDQRQVHGWDHTHQVRGIVIHKGYRAKLRNGLCLGTPSGDLSAGSDDPRNRKPQILKVLGSGIGEPFGQRSHTDQVVALVGKTFARFQRTRDGRNRAPELHVKGRTKLLQLIAHKPPGIPALHRPIGPWVVQDETFAEDIEPRLRVGGVVVQQYAVAVERNGFHEKFGVQVEE